MNFKSTLALFVFAPVFIIYSGAASAEDRTAYLGLCQELVNSARSYEARATQHHTIAKSLVMQIENVAKMPKNQGTQQAMDNIFAQYDENRMLEHKFRELYRQATEEAKRCMKSVE